jgi:hypothetical protein
MSRVSTLKENRESAAATLEATIDEFDGFLADRALTDDETARLEGERKRLTQIESSLSDAEAREAEAAAEQETREGKLGHQGTGGADEVRTDESGQVRVGNEPLTYGQGNPDNSFYRDLLYSANPNTRGFDQARDRLRRHSDELDAIKRYTPASPEGRAIKNYEREVRRQTAEETRDVSTETSSMGDFAPPLYFLKDYAAYRTYGRTLIDNLKPYPLPATGMTFNVPQITTPTEAANQTTATQGAGENMSVSTRDMTSDYQTGTLQTIVDNLLVSQQYLDRVGPGIGGDEIVRDDQQRQVNRTLNIYAWESLFATPGVGNVLYTDTAFNAYKFNQVVHTAKANIRKTDGVVAYPTHFITDVDLWESVEGSYDSNNRPFVVPQGVAFNPLAVGDNNDAPEGYTGFRFAGLPAYADQAAEVAWSSAGSAGYTGDHVALVGALDIAAFWLEGAPVIRVLPQPYATTLTVVIQQYVYAAFVPVYPGALQLVYGTGTSTLPN